MATATKCSTVVGVFATQASAEKAYADLRAEGFRDDEIGLVGKDMKGNVVRKGTAHGNNAGEGAAIGAAAGIAGGAAVGAGIIAGVIPVIGPILAIGTLGTILLNAAGGAVIAGIAGSLIGWGIPAEDAKYYEERVNEGHYLVTAKCENHKNALPIFTRHGGYGRWSEPV